MNQRHKVEHTLAHVRCWQSRRARDRGPRKKLFDVRRAAVIHNLYVILTQPPPEFRGTVAGWKEFISGWVAGTG